MTDDTLPAGLVKSILAREALKPGAQCAPVPEPSRDEQVRTAYTNAEVDLTTIALSVRASDNFLPRELVFEPGRGLLVRERNGGGGYGWRTVPPSILSVHLVLLGKLLHSGRDRKVREDARSAAAQAQGAVAAARVVEEKVYETHAPPGWDVVR